MITRILTYAMTASVLAVLVVLMSNSAMADCGDGGPGSGCPGVPTDRSQSIVPVLN